MLRLSRSSLTLSVVLLALPILAASAQTQDPWSRPTTYHANEKPLADVLRDIASTTKTRIELTPAAKPLAEAAKISTSMDEVSLRTAIESIVRVVNVGGKRLTARFDDSRCVIDTVDTPAAGRLMGGRVGGLDARRLDNSPDRRLVTYSATGVTAVKALTDVLDKEKLGYRIHPLVRKAMNVRIERLTAESLELRSILGLIAQNVHIPNARVTWWYETDPGYYVFVPEPMVEQPILRDETVTLTTRDEPVATAVKRAMDAAGASYAFSPQVLGESPATIEVKNVPLDLAIRRLFRSGRVPESFSLDGSGGVFTIRQDPAERSRVPVEPTYTARFDNSDIRYALKALFLATSENYTLDTHVSGTVTTAFQNLPLRAALEQVLKNAKSPLTLTYRLDGTVYKVYPNKDWENWK